MSSIWFRDHIDDQALISISRLAVTEWFRVGEKKFVHLYISHNDYLWNNHRQEYCYIIMTYTIMHTAAYNGYPYCRHLLPLYSNIYVYVGISAAGKYIIIISVRCDVIMNGPDWNNIVFYIRNI